MTYVPNWWEAVLLAFAAFRWFRIIGWDTITEPVRNRIVRLGGKNYREKLAVFLQCPWCAGFYIVVIWWGLWLLWPHATLIAATPFALNTVVGFLGKLDEQGE